MPSTGPFWYAVLPCEGTALNDNPSWERGTAGAGAIESAGLGSTANEQQFGAWSLFCTPTSNGTSGAYLGTAPASNGSAYSYSAYIQGVNGVSYMLAVADTSNALIGSAPFTGGGTWQRYIGSYTEASGANRRVIVRKASGNDTGTFYVDGWNFSPGSAQTYIDGDQEGCSWLGAPHASQSVRSGQSRAGGSVVALSALGFTVDESIGIGMPTVENSSQSYAIVPGAEFQRQRARERTITLTSYLTGTSWANLHQLRTAAINAFKIDLVATEQPTRFYYVGGLGTVQIDAIYDGGLEFGKPEGFEETVSVRFIAYQPYWTAVTDEGTALASRVGIGSANHILRRDSLGRWGTMGQNGTTFQGVSATGGVSDILAYNGTVFACGSWGTAGGTKAPNIAMYYPALNQWGTLGPGTIVQAGPLQKLAIAPWGSLYVGGFLQTTAGTNTRLVAQWSAGGWGSLPGGTIGTSGASWVQTMLFNAGTLFLAGLGMVSAAGTAGTAIFMWSRGSWGTLAGGTVTGGNISALTMGLDNRLYLGGPFTGAAGSTANRVARWDANGFGTLGYGMDQSVFGLASGPNGVIYAGGPFAVAGSSSAACMAQYTGAQWFPMGSGLVNTLSAAIVFDVFADQRNGDVIASGIFNYADGLKIPDSIARWTGYAWVPLDVDITSTQGTFQAVEQDAAGNLYAGGTFAGTAQAAAVAPVVNTGRALGYPILKSRNIGSGTARLFQLLNPTTGARLFFNYILQPGEEVELNLAPGARSFTSDYSGNIFGAIVPGSNLASWNLLSGTNYLSFFADSDNLVNSIYWRPRHWSADSGTVS